MAQPVSEDRRDERRRGLAQGLGAYLLWGIFPLYFPLLAPAGPVEILADRIVWSLVVVVAILAVSHNWGWLPGLWRDVRRLTLLTAAAVLIAVNWGVYIYAVNSDQVVEAALGYFINPLVSVVFGVVLLHERLRPGQWVAVGLGAVAVLVLTADYGAPPWIALTLALTFGSYGLTKKKLGMPAVPSLAGETGVLFAPAVAYLVWLQLTGSHTLTTEGPGHAALMVSTGVVTAVPLLLFGAAVNRIPLSWVGLIQYVTPVMQFLIGIGVYHEPMPPSRWLGFSLVWAALLIVSVDGALAARAGTRTR